MPPSKANNQDQAIRQGSGQTANKNAQGRSFIQGDFPLIRNAILALGASLLLSMILTGTGSSILTRQQKALVLAQTQRDEALGKLRQTETDNQAIQDYQGKYLQLYQRGFVGEERRLNWMEHIKFIQKNRKLFPITYEITAQQVFQLPPEIATGDLELRGSKMKFQMDLLHEGDLLNFLNDLTSAGLYTVQDCALRRSDTLAETRISPRLAAECSLYWLTLGEITSNQEQTPP